MFVCHLHSSDLIRQIKMDSNMLFSSECFSIVCCFSILWPLTTSPSPNLAYQSVFFFLPEGFTLVIAKRLARVSVTSSVFFLNKQIFLLLTLCVFNMLLCNYVCFYFKSFCLKKTLWDSLIRGRKNLFALKRIINFSNHFINC